VRAFEAEHGALPEGAWLLLRTGWDARARSGCLPQRLHGQPHTPGIDAECARWLAQETRSSASASRPSAPTRALPASTALPVHHFVLGAGTASRSWPTSPSCRPSAPWSSWRR
jgi:kynurenine formamidase